MEKKEENKCDEVITHESKYKETELATCDGEQLYLDHKKYSGGFSQWNALSPIKRAKYEAEAKLSVVQCYKECICCQFATSYMCCNSLL